MKHRWPVNTMATWRVGFVAGLDDLVVPHRAPGVGHRGDALADAHVHAVPKGEEGVGDHGGADEAALGLFGLHVDGHLVRGVPFGLEDFQLQVLVGHAELLEAQGVGVLGVGLEDRDLRHAHPVLFPGADAHGAAVLDKDDGVGGDALLHPPAEEEVFVLRLAGLADATVFLALVGGRGGFEILFFEDGVQGRLLDDDAAVDEALKIHEAVVDQVLEAAEAGHPHDPRSLAFFRISRVPASKSGAARPPPGSSGRPARRWPCPGAG